MQALPERLVLEWLLNSWVLTYMGPTLRLVAVALLAVSVTAGAKVRVAAAVANSVLQPLSL